MSESVDSLIAFLGAPKHGYKEATYHWQGESYLTPTPFCPEALVFFFRPKRLVVMVTETARQLYLADLAGRASKHGCEVVWVDIPEEASEASLWAMFDACVQSIRPGERVIFDVTYGFRFIPMLMLLAGRFLAVTRGVKTAGIYYGAFDATDQQGQTPIANLTPLNELMDWIEAAAHFEATGNALLLSKQVKKTGDKTLREAEIHLQETSEGLRLGIASQVGLAVSQLLAALQRTPAQSATAASPTRVLFAEIAAKFTPLALAERLDQTTAGQHLRQQAALITWYGANQLGMQAALLAREWLVTWTMLVVGHTQLLDWDTRHTITIWLAKAARGDLVAREQLATVPSLEQTLQLWARATRVRNQLAHMAMLEKPAPLTIRQVKHHLDFMTAGINLLTTQLPD